MAGNKRLRNKVSKLIDRFNSVFVRELAYLMAYKIEETLSMEIDRFYDDYTPKHYNRSYGLYKSVLTRVMIGPGGSYYIGLYVGSEKMEQSWYSDPVDYVYVGAIGLGVHGTKDIHVTHPTPFRGMNNKIRRMNFSAERKEAFKRAIAAAGLRLK